MGRGHRGLETTKATDCAVAFRRTSLARLAVILAKIPSDVARQKVVETRSVPQDSEWLCNGSQLHATSARIGDRAMSLRRLQMLDHDRQCRLPTTPGSGPVTGEAATDFFPRVPLRPHPDEVSLFLLKPLHPPPPIRPT